MIIKAQILTIFAIIWTSMAANANYADCSMSGRLGDMLPVALVEELQSHGHWKMSFDESQTPQAQKLAQYWQSLGQMGTPEHTVDLIFESSHDIDPTQRFPDLYATKVYILRYLNEHLQFTCIDQNNIERAYQSWINRYIYHYALPLIETAQIPQYAPIIRNFKFLFGDGQSSALNNKGYKIVDLSPQQRQKMKSITPERHHDDLTELDPQTGQYAVTGFYTEKHKTLAIDFARHHGETLITFAHELVHAADPELEKAYAVSNELYPQVIAIVNRWLRVNEDSSWVGDFIDQVLFEVKESSFVDYFLDLTNEHLDTLAKKVKEDLGVPEVGPLEPTPEELSIVRRYFAAQIELTVCNEYKAYGLSAILYYKLNLGMIMPPSKHLQQNLNRILQGDDFFAVNLFLEKGLSPFPHLRQLLSQKQMALIEAQENVEPGQDPQFEKELEQMLRVSRSLNYLELEYLNSVKSFVESLGSEFSTQVTRLQNDVKNKRFEHLPYYARPGNFNSPTNPTSVLAARLTTAWILRFKKNIQLVHQYVVDANDRLVSLELGIVDLHDLDEADQKLVGIKYSDSESAAIDPRLEGLFSLVEFNPNISVLSPETRQENTTIRPHQLMGNLTKLNLAKSYYWLEESFPVYDETLIGMATFLNKLQNGNYDRSELSEGRAAELQNELFSAFATTSQTRDEVFKMTDLMNSLGNLYEIASDQQLSDLATKFQNQAKMLDQAIEMQGVYGSLDSLTWQSQLGQIKAEFHTSLKDHHNKCRRGRVALSENIPAYSSISTNIAGATVDLSSLCYQKQLYLFRQPGDATQPLTTIPKEIEGVMRPVSILARGGRPLTYAAYEKPKKPKKPWKWWWQ